MKRYLPYVLLICLCSCTKILGIKKLRHMDEHTIAATDRRLKIHTAFIADTSYLHAFKGQHFSKQLKKDLHQPLQFWLMTRDSVVCNIVNCYAKGFPNLKWDFGKLYAARTVWSPVDDKPALVHTMQQLYNLDFAAHDSIVVICYANFIGRQNKRFIKSGRRFLASHPGVQPCYVNTDNIFEGAL